MNSEPAPAKTAPPRYMTPRDPSLETDGPAAAKISAYLGEPFTPWQTAAADVGLERLPDGRPRYPIVVVTVPRQAGKTTLLRAVAVHKMLKSPGRRVFYTAQTGKDARERWSDLVTKLERNPETAPRFKTYLGAGSPRLIHPASGSRYSPFSPSAESLHGYTPHDVQIDEAFALSEVAGDLLMGAIVPAQSTLPDAQIWIVSTMGTAESVFFDKWVEAGRAGQPGVCLIDYGAPENMDVYNPENWPHFHPGIGYTTDADRIALAAQSLSRSEFERAYGNRRTATRRRLIPAEIWTATEATPEQLALPEPGTWTLAYDVSFNRDAAAIVGAWKLPDGRTVTRVLERRPGYSWLPAAVTDWNARGRPAQIIADDGGAAREVTPLIAHPVRTLGGRAFAAATGNYLNRIESGEILHDADAIYSTAAEVAATRLVSDSPVFTRRHSAGDISPMVAAAVAAWAETAETADVAPPAIYTPDGLE